MVYIFLILLIFPQMMPKKAHKVIPACKVYIDIKISIRRFPEKSFLS